MIVKKVKSTGLFNFLLLLLVVFSGCSLGNGESEDPADSQLQELISRLNQQSVALNAPPLQLPDSALSFLDRLGGVRIVGMGEATHGSREFFQMKHRVFRYLVERFGFRAIAFEADFSESVYINRYISGGGGNLDTIMTGVMQSWSWRTAEVKALLQWMRQYNATRPPDEHILYYGLDCQSTTFQPALMQEYFNGTVPALWTDISSIMEEIRGYSDFVYQNMPEADYHSKASRLEAFLERMEADKDRLSAMSSAKDYELYRQVFENFRQAFELKYNIYSGNGGYTRDLSMADNALWLAGFLGPEAKITLWAHNGHIAKDPDYIGDGSMGFKLFQNQGEHYRSIGFGFSTGEFNAEAENETGQIVGVESFEIESEPREDSINQIWRRASHSDFVFDIEVFMADSEWHNQLTEALPFLMVGSSYNGNPPDYYRSTDIPLLYDMIIYFDSTRATQIF